jgi:thiol-disulfide isomerase/thioredoxin
MWHFSVFWFEKTYTTKAAVQRFGMTYPATATTTENHTVTTIKINKTQLQQVNESQFRKAPEFVQISGYIDTPNNNPLTLSSLKGKVVLVYIWTYTCINSIRPMPCIHDWNQKYSDKGLVIVGLHAPEFTFE